jgi:uncharacterized protein YqeY
MNISDQLREELKSAMKSGDALKRDALRLIISQLKYAQIDNKKELTPDQEISILSTAAKRRKEAIELYQQGNRPDLVEKEQYEYKLITSYLPVQLSDEAIYAAVDKAIQDAGAKTINDVGKVMSLIMKGLKGQVDGTKVQQLVRQKLG